MKFNNLEITILTFIRLNLLILDLKFIDTIHMHKFMMTLQEKKEKKLEESIFCILTTYPGPHSDSVLTGITILGL